jgi:hypothetical protein
MVSSNIREIHISLAVETIYRYIAFQVEDRWKISYYERRSRPCIRIPKEGDVRAGFPG